MLIVKILNFTDSSLLRVLQEKTPKIGAQIFTRESKGPNKSDKLVGHILTHSQMALEPPWTALLPGGQENLCPVISHILIGKLQRNHMQSSYET